MGLPVKMPDINFLGIRMCGDDTGMPRHLTNFVDLQAIELQLWTWVLRGRSAAFKAVTSPRWKMVFTGAFTNGLLLDS